MSRVESYAASNLRYVGEAKLARLSDADLVELHKLLKYKLGEVPTALPADKPATIKAILDLKVRIGIISKAEADAAAGAVAAALTALGVRFDEVGPEAAGCAGPEVAVLRFPPGVDAGAVRAAMAAAAGSAAGGGA